MPEMTGAELSCDTGVWMVRLDVPDNSPAWSVAVRPRHEELQHDLHLGCSMGAVPPATWTAPTGRTSELTVHECELGLTPGLQLNIPRLPARLSSRDTRARHRRRDAKSGPSFLSVSSLATTQPRRRDVLQHTRGVSELFFCSALPCS